MKPGINTAVITFKGDPSHEEEEVIRRLHEAGFETMDFSLANTTAPAHIQQADDWQKRADRAAEAAAKYGMRFSQVHLPFQKQGLLSADVRFRDPDSAKHYEECMFRGYRIAAMVGAPWAVLHCLDSTAERTDPDEAFRLNHEYFDHFVEFGIQNGVGTAFENMIRVNPRFNPHYRYTEGPEELIAYVDSYHDPMVGICWDFGHANLARVTQTDALRMIGKRLKCVHVDDNLGANDNHLLPFFGEIDWNEIFPVLAEIGYEGSCSLEVRKPSAKAPEAIQEVFIHGANVSCRCLCDIYDRAVETISK